jgi:hypothetical protein
MRAIFTTLLTVVAATTLASGDAPAQTRHIEAQMLPQYGGDWYTAPTAINNRGEIVGWAVHDTSVWGVAFLRTQSGDYLPIAESAFPTDINDRGTVVGRVALCGGYPAIPCRQEGFRWSRGAGLRMLGSFFPNAINERGEMAGFCRPDEQQLPAACVMRRDGVVTPIALPPSEARGINAYGEVVGVFGDNRAFHLTRRGQFKDIGRAVANDINDSGLIAGHRWLFLPERGERAVATAWTRRQLRSPALEASVGAAVNRDGWVIANAYDAQERPYSFIWNPTSGARVMLTGADGSWMQLVDLNDRGIVLGQVGAHAALWHVRNRDMTARFDDDDDDGGDNDEDDDD